MKYGVYPYIIIDENRGKPRRPTGPEGHRPGKDYKMTSKEAYNMDLDELRTAIDALLAAVPSSTKRSDAHRREEAERVASSARALIGCMRNDYIVGE